jgi:hypothetical protein
MIEESGLRHDSASVAECHGWMAKCTKLVGCGTLFLSETGRKGLCAENLQNDEGGCKGRNYVFVWHISPKSSG